MNLRPSLYRLVVVLLVLVGVGFWLFNVSRPGTRAIGCADGCVAAPPRAPGPLRVVTLNMLHGFPHFRYLPQRLDIIARELRRLDADIVLLQEVPWTRQTGYAAEHLGRALGYNHVYLRANGNRWAILFEEGEAILSRFPLRDVAFTELPPRAGFFEHRVALKATVITPWGDIDVYSTHLTNGPQAINAGQAQHLRAFVQETAHHPAIVAGDFNAEEGEPHMADLARAWQDAYQQVHPGEPGFTCCVDDLRVQDVDLTERIDYIFLVPAASSTLQAVTARRVFDHPFPQEDGVLWASDHVGVMVEVVVGSPPESHAKDGPNEYVHHLPRH